MLNLLGDSFSKVKTKPHSLKLDFAVPAGIGVSQMKLISSNRAFLVATPKLWDL